MLVAYCYLKALALTLLFHQSHKKKFLSWVESNMVNWFVLLEMMYTSTTLKKTALECKEILSGKVDN